MGRTNLMSMLKNASQPKIDYGKKFCNDFIFSIESLAKKNSRPPTPTLKPSSLRCLRSGFFQMVQAPYTDSSSYSLIGICEGGTFIHEMVQSKVTRMEELGIEWQYINVADYVRENNLNLEILKECNFEKGEYETKLQHNGYKVRFLADGILKYRDKYFILEIKSISSNGFFKLKEVPEKYKTQAVSYSVLLGIDTVLFLFVDRDLFNMKTFEYTPTAEEKAEWKLNLEYVTECVEKRVVPNKPINADAKFCAYCNYKSVCNKYKDEEVYEK